MEKSMKTQTSIGRIFAWLCLILISACNLSTLPTPTATATKNKLIPTAVIEPSPAPFPSPTLAVTGRAETVFLWARDKCVKKNIPDLPFRAFRDSANQVQGILSMDINYRMIGSDLNHLKVDCDPIMTSKYNADPSMYEDAQWVAALYTEDGQTIYTLIHNEYQGHTHPGKCPQHEYFPCWDNSITLAISTDSGKTYRETPPPPGNLVARFPYPYQAGKGPEGFRNPSNIIKGKDGFYYAFFNAIEYGTQKQWVCLMRTDDLSQPGSWQFWNGSSFDGTFSDPYRSQNSEPLKHICPPIDLNNIGASMNESITFNTYLNRYVLIGISADHISGREVWGFYYAFSDDLTHWSHRNLLMEVPLPWTVKSAGDDLSFLYPTLIDPDSPSRNFETTDDTAYLYFTRHTHGQASLDRDLIRVPVQFFPTSSAAKQAEVPFQP